ncbi:MAG: Hsp20/alpha crystallin family protein [Anaerolineaceae bacterium]|nr:Hsp20/alpha crystallin family protein [Anaerolineaceae bacterium]
MAYYISNPVPRISQRMLKQLFDDTVEQEHNVYFPVDIKMDDATFEISAVLPGVNHEDINITVENEVVSISGEFNNTRDENETYLLTERPFGDFKRTLNLKIALDAENAQAEMKDGILTLRVPKAKEALPRSIKIKAK